MLYKREILSDILAHCNNKEIILLTGARQTGKTTLLRQVEKEMSDKKSQTFFLNLENLEFVKLLNESPENIFKIFPLKKSRSFSSEKADDADLATRQYVFVDEVQYLKNPTNFLKYLYDEYAGQIRFIVTGSSAFYIDKKFKDSLAGRKKIFYVYPLRLRDFLIFKERADILAHIPKAFSLDNIDLEQTFPRVFVKDLEVLIEELMVYGGYPRVALAENTQEKKAVLEEIASAYIKKDVLEADIKTGEKYYDLFRLLSAQIGSQINTNELANTLDLSRPTISNYLYVMQKSFHFALVKPFSRNRRKEITKMPKGYFYDTGLRNYFINNFNPMTSRQDPGQLFENFVFTQLLASVQPDDIRYWRTVAGDEVDFVVREDVAFEVKYRSTGFLKGKYDAFTKQYHHVPLYSVSHLIDKKDENKTWRLWMM